MNTHPRERGQALILITFAAIGLFAITALAIDGGAVLPGNVSLKMQPMLPPWPVPWP